MQGKGWHKRRVIRLYLSGLASLLVPRFMDTSPFTSLVTYVHFQMGGVERGQLPIVMLPDQGHQLLYLEPSAIQESRQRCGIGEMGVLEIKACSARPTLLPETYSTQKPSPRPPLKKRPGSPC